MKEKKIVMNSSIALTNVECIHNVISDIIALVLA